MKKSLILHPFLFALFPILSLFSHNLGRVLVSEILIPTAIVLCFTATLIVFWWLVLKDVERAGIIASGFLAFSFSFGHVVVSIRGWGLGYFVIGDYTYLVLTIWIAFLAFYIYVFARTRMHLPQVTQILNIVSLSLVIMPLMTIGYHGLRGGIAWRAFQGAKEIQAADLTAPDKLPDIYYIILDTYGDSTTLKEIYDFDNSDFMNYLSHKGFYVAPRSKSNYLKTAHSLASSLNMVYLNDLSDRAGKESYDWSPLFTMLQDYKVWRLLKSKGYKFIHFGSWWGPTSKNKYADINFNSSLLTPFFYVLYENSVFYPLSSQLGGLDFRRANWKRVLYQFDKLAEIPNLREPTFVFAHMLITHEPYAFDRDGEFLIAEEYAKRSREENYVNQVIFANKKIKLLIDELLSRSEVPPIIVLQSDEGPWPQRYVLDEGNFNWKLASQEELREKMGILNAYYLPGIDRNVLYESITPVNSFRVIFNLYFNANLELLPDESYAFEDQNHPYKLFNVTGKLKHN